MIVVTRHAALVELLRERGIVGKDVKVLAHATPEDIRGQHVIGVLPLSLAALADRVTEIALTLKPEDRGKELDLSRLRQVAGSARTYQVREVAE
jgi:putative CRISPR-associated protein (TIGR02620 family)